MSMVPFDEKTIQRFWAKVDRRGPDDCWLWKAASNQKGIGHCWDGRKRRIVQAHRFAFEITNGPFPEGIAIVRTCHNRLCVNPAHLARKEPLPYADHFMSYVLKTDGGCWEWQGLLTNDGYGRFGGSRQGEPGRAHRISWTLANGPIPDGLFVCHRCDNPSCVRPDHLFLGTPAENDADKRSKRREARGEMYSTARLNADQVREIRRLYSESGLSQRAIAHKFGICRNHVFMIVARRMWSHVA